MLRTHCQTSGWSLAAQDVFNNVPRTCIEAAAAVAGRWSLIQIHWMRHWAYQLIMRIARNTQLHLRNNMAHVIDPFGGSYLVEV